MILGETGGAVLGGGGWTALACGGACTALAGAGAGFAGAALLPLALFVFFLSLSSARASPNVQAKATTNTTTIHNILPQVFLRFMAASKGTVFCEFI